MSVPPRPTAPPSARRLTPGLALRKVAQHLATQTALCVSLPRHLLPRRHGCCVASTRGLRGHQRAQPRAPPLECPPQRLEGTCAAMSPAAHLVPRSPAAPSCVRPPCTGPCDVLPYFQTAEVACPSRLGTPCHSLTPIRLPSAPAGPITPSRTSDCTRCSRTTRARECRLTGSQPSAPSRRRRARVACEDFLHF